MTSIAQLIKTSEYVCTGRYPVQASAVFLNELMTSLLLFSSRFYFFVEAADDGRCLPTFSFLQIFLSCFIHVWFFILRCYVSTSFDVKN